jgi:hypothetical protein
MILIYRVQGFEAIIAIIEGASCPEHQKESALSNQRLILWQGSSPGGSSVQISEEALEVESSEGRSAGRKEGGGWKLRGKKEGRKGRSTRPIEGFKRG